MEHGAETGQHPLMQQPFEAGQQILLTHAQLSRNCGIRALTKREAILQTIDDGAIECIQLHHAAALA